MRLFITNSDSQFQAPLGLLEFQCRNTLMTGMWDSFSPLHLGWLRVHLPRAQVAAYIMCHLLVEAGYFIGVHKSQSTPSTLVCFLGFVCDSLRQAFLIPEDKKTKFAALKEGIHLLS